MIRALKKTFGGGGGGGPVSSGSVSNSSSMGSVSSVPLSPIGGDLKPVGLSSAATASSAGREVGKKPPRLPAPAPHNYRRHASKPVLSKVLRSGAFPVVIQRNGNNSKAKSSRSWRSPKYPFAATATATEATQSSSECCCSDDDAASFSSSASSADFAQSCKLCALDRHRAERFWDRE